MHLQWKRQTGDAVDCKGGSFKVTKGGSLADGVDVLSSGYDIHFDNPKNCINKATKGGDIRIKVHDNCFMELLTKHSDATACSLQTGGPVNGDGTCDDWDKSHTEACKRRAGRGKMELSTPPGKMPMKRPHGRCRFDLDGVDSSAQVVRWDLF